MNVQQFLTTATQKLVAADIKTARLDCLVLLEDALGADRSLLLAHPERELSHAQSTRLNTLITRRIQHEPLAYLRGKVMFYGREFAVNNSVLVPRPESESVINLLKAAPLPPGQRIADIGTGSGCLGITAGLEVQKAYLYVYDIDPAALKITQQNAQAHHMRVQAAQQNLLEGCSEHFDVILANLPYVPLHYPVNAAAQHEPEHALFAGNDGLALYRTFWRQMQQLSAPPQYVIIESLTTQHQALEELAQSAGYALTAHEGLAQAFAHMPS